MSSTGGLPRDPAISTRYAGAPRAVRAWWAAGVLAAVSYGLFLVMTSLSAPAGAELTGRFWAQPATKASMAILFAVAAACHPIVRERRWLVGALVLSAVGDFFLAIPWWTPAFVSGLGAFLLAHLCYLGALLPLTFRGEGTNRRTRLAAVAVVVILGVGMLTRLWPRLRAEAVTLPVTLYITVLVAMVCAALLARLPTVWTAVGAVLFAVSDAMIGVGEFVLGSEALELPIWWVYAASQALITAGLFFGRRA
jgi:uncharacterized membrane protein YhhN